MRIGESFRAYRAREARAPGGFFGYENPAHVHRVHECYEETLRLLKTFGYESLSAMHVLGVGCGDSVLLRQFPQMGAAPEQLAGIELRPDPVEKAHSLNPTFDLRLGSANDLPWRDTSFDLVCQHTVFTSILDERVKTRVASEMGRVLRPGGAVLWYDFMYDNPRNPDVKGIQAREIRKLFPEFELHLRRITLVPFIARRLPRRLLPLAYPLITAIPFFRTHVLGLLLKPTSVR